MSTKRFYLENLQFSKVKKPMAFEFEADETIVRGRTPLKELRDFPLEH